MYERFTDRARRVIVLANEEAQRLKHEDIGTEHILLGLLKEGRGVAAQVLENLRLDPRSMALEVEKLVLQGRDTDETRENPPTPRAKKVIEYAMEEARNLKHGHVGTEHILLGLVREQEGVASHILMNHGVRAEVLRAEIEKVLSATKGTMSQMQDPSELPAVLSTPRTQAGSGWSEAGLAAVLLRLLGVYFTAWGVIYGTEPAFRLVLHVREFGLENALLSQSSYLIYTAAHLVVGIYFLFGGRWVFEKVLTPIVHNSADDSLANIWEEAATCPQGTDDSHRPRTQ